MSFKTYNDVSLPTFMYGTAWKKDATTKLVEDAVAAGFTAIDTANQLIHYQEELVGEALLNLQKKGISRESLFLQTKFTSTGGQDHRTPYDAAADLTTQVKQSFESSLKHLHTNYLDSYVLHSPYQRNGLGAKDWEVWTEIEQHYAAGKTKIIGISNVTAEQLDQLCGKAKTKPMLVQNRCYAIAGWDKEVRDICIEHGIIYQGFSLLTANSQFMGLPAIQAIAQRLKTGAAQVIFRFSIQIGMLPLTGTTNSQHMKDDLKAEKLVLTDADMATIESIAL
ncbi:MAG: aldo/keto reductase [Leptolyngbya sp.]|nr:aldo/keto reductase [Candidatus Melainabacteria bacterium]